jgi:hypothetical protein
VSAVLQRNRAARKGKYRREVGSAIGEERMRRGRRRRRGPSMPGSVKTEDCSEDVAQHGTEEREKTRRVVRRNRGGEDGRSGVLLLVPLRPARWRCVVEEVGEQEGDGIEGGDGLREEEISGFLGGKKRQRRSYLRFHRLRGEEKISTLCEKEKEKEDERKSTSRTR